MRFTYFWPWWAVILGLAIMAGVTVYAYLCLKRVISWRLKSLLIALRILAFSVLLFCLLEPVFVEEIDVTPPMHLPILADTSRSMELQDVEFNGESATRITLANHLLFDASNRFLSSLNERFETHLYRFGEQSQQISEQPSPLDIEGSLTDIAASIQAAAREWRGQQTAGIVLITDGAHNASTFPLDDVLQLQIPIYSIGIGNPEPPKDLKIAKIEVNPVVHVEHEVPVYVSVQSNGYSGDQVRVALRRAENSENEESVVDATSVVLSDDAARVVEFNLTPKSEGSFKYTASVPTLNGEVSSDNNRKTFLLKVVKTKLHVLYIDGRPRWDYVFLKRALERDPNIESTCLILSGKSSYQLRDTLLNAANGYYPQNTNHFGLRRFPDSLRELMVYDVLIVGDIISSTLNAIQQAAVVEFVEKHGKSVVFLGGKRSLGINGLVKTRLAGILPVVLPPNGLIAKNEDFTLELTPSGLYHPITRLANTTANNEAIWRDLPPLSRWLGGAELRGGATELSVYHRDALTSPIPIIMFQRSGLGKSLLIAAEGVWNWGFGVWSFKNEDDAYPRFWAQTIRWLATSGEENQISVTTNLTTYSVGDIVGITVFAYDESYQPLNDAVIEIDVLPPSNQPFQIRASANGAGAGAYTAQFRADSHGNYSIKASGRQGEVVLGEDSTEVFAQLQLAELENPQLNESLLKQLAAKTGGAYLPVADASALPEKISAIQQPVMVTEERELWDTALVLISVVALLGMEWLLRKRKGLV
ncbi:MAG: hypothetical protein OXN17_07400 [Candidatus Poribacteria bacterium]|nr:hypothetical protein [Candidatus Poribacteria bacterium]MDE0503813.1 hypothetical protein [Candidatus Poribacteria bacterium]